MSPRDEDGEKQDVPSAVVPSLSSGSSTPAGGGPGGPSNGLPTGKPRGPPPPHVLARIGMKALARNGTLLLVVLWAAGMWLYGSPNGAGNRLDRLKVLVRDLDGGQFGTALLDSAKAATGPPSSPTFVVSTTATEADLFDGVFNGTYWAAISATPGSFASFQAALSNSTAASAYNASTVFTTHVATVRYYTTFVSFVLPGVNAVLDHAMSLASQSAVSLTWNSTSRSLDSTQLAIVAAPAGYTQVDVAPLIAQSRVFFNTFGIVISHLSQFFFNMMLNGIFTGVGIYRNTTWRKLLESKYPVKIIWTLITSLSIASFPVIFDQSAKLPAKNFFALWAVEWVYTCINFNTIGTVLVLLPVPFVPLFVFPWVVTSLVACLIPIELSNVVYRLCYVWPSHSYYNTIITIWGNGAVNRLSLYLPLLAAWLVVSELAWLLADGLLAKRSTKPPAAGPGGLPGGPPGGHGGPGGPPGGPPGVPSRV